MLRRIALLGMALLLSACESMARGKVTGAHRCITKPAMSSIKWARFKLT